MKFFDRNSNRDRIDDEVEPLVQALLANKQLFDEDTEDASHVTDAIKYKSQPQKRRQISPYEGDDEFVHKIKDIFGFEPLDFQVESWQLVNRLDRQRRNGAGSQAAIFSAPTGFGKTEAFLGPIYQLLQEGRLGSTVIVYPRRALLQNQFERILEHIHEMRDFGPSSISVGVYMGNMPYELSDVRSNDNVFEGSHGRPRFTLANCWCGDDDDTHPFHYFGTSNEYRIRCENNSDHEFTDSEIVLHRTGIIEHTPDILLTTLESLELFAMKPNYDIIDDVDTIVLDEFHLYTGLRGAHTAKIIENINDITDNDLLWLGASATVDNPKRFGKKLFDITGDNLETVDVPDSDIDRSSDDKEHYYFMISPEEGPGASSMMIQQLMMIGHSMLEQNGWRGKILSFIDSTSQINQKWAQLQDADNARQLWQYHRTGSGPENWNRLSEAMGYEFIEEPLDFLRVFSEIGFDADEAAHNDVLLSTSFLEVGIDVGEISVVTQYRTPQDISSFIQRTGRAAREEDMDSHIFVFLSNLTGDANMFYRADRFMESNLRTPLKPDNEVVEWIHSQLHAYYDVSTDIRNERFMSLKETETEFFDRLIREEVGFDAFYQFLTEPKAFLDEYLGLPDGPREALVAEEPIEELKDVLTERQAELKSELDEINEYVEVDGDTIVRGDDAFEQYLTEIESSMLEAVNEFESILEEFEETLASGDIQTPSGQIDTIRSELEEAKQQIVDSELHDHEQRVTEYNNLLATLPGTAGQLMGLRNQVSMIVDGDVRDVPLRKIEDLQNAVDLLSGMAGDERLEKLRRELKQIYYLNQTISKLREYRDYTGGGDPYPKPWLSLWYVKELFRAGYYLNRCLAVTGDDHNKDIWYIPENYFDSSGRYFTVFYGENDIEGNEESMDSIVSTHAPYNSEYQGDSGTLQVFMPKTRVVPPEEQDDTTDEPAVVFDYRQTDMDVDKQERMWIPETITLSTVKDLTDDSARNIVRYCPDCLQIISNIDQCPRHGDRAFGKIHSSPQVKTVTQDRDPDESLERLTLADVVGDVTLQGVTLTITPAKWAGNDIGYIWKEEPQEQREIRSPDPPLGFTLDTRGLVFDIKDFIDQLDDDLRNEVNRYKDLDTVDLEYLAYHTAAHYLMQIVSDVSGVNTNMLFYGMDQSTDEIFIFERTEGGQGIVDLVFNEVQNDPGTVLEAMNRTGYNPQVLNERLWADDTAVDALPADRQLSEDDAKQVVDRYYDDVLYDSVRERVGEEFVSTADRAAQLRNNVRALSLEDAYEIKYTIASEQVDGADEFPETAVRDLDIEVTEELIETSKSLFYSPDIDGCVENLHLSECISGHDQTESLSYVMLEAFRDYLTLEVAGTDTVESMFDTEQLPAATIDDTHVFLEF
jgi:superfamily II DNA/RNA helicase